jgi:hypothetical protein
MLSVRPVRPLLAVAAFSVAACGSRGASTTNDDARAVAGSGSTAAATAAVALASALTQTTLAAAAATEPATLDTAQQEVMPRLMPNGRPAPGNVGKKMAAPQPDSPAVAALAEGAAPPGP